MPDIVHKKVKQVVAICEDGTSIVVDGPGTVHINDTEIKTDKGQPNIPTRQLLVSMRVDKEEYQ